MKSNRFIRLTHNNMCDMYESGYMAKGNLVKYRYNGHWLHNYGLDSNDNEWRVGIISHIHRISFMRGSLQIVINEEWLNERMDFIYDLVVFPNCGTYPTETISLEGYEIYLAKV